MDQSPKISINAELKRVAKNPFIVKSFMCIALSVLSVWIVFEDYKRMDTESYLNLKIFSVIVSLLLFLPTLKESLLLFRLMWHSETRVIYATLMKRVLSQANPVGIGCFDYICKLIFVFICSPCYILDIKSQNTQTTLIGLLDMLQTLVLLPLSVIVIFCSETPSDIFINLVALQAFASLDDVAAEATGLLKNRIFVERMCLLYYEWCGNEEQDEKPKKEEEVTWEEKIFLRRWQKDQEQPRQRVDVILNSILTRLKAVDKKDGYKSCAEAWEGKSLNWRDIVKQNSPVKSCEKDSSAQTQEISHCKAVAVIKSKLQCEEHSVGFKESKDAVEVVTKSFAEYNSVFDNKVPENYERENDQKQNNIKPLFEDFKTKQVKKEKLEIYQEKLVGPSHIKILRVSFEGEESDSNKIESQLRTILKMTPDSCKYLRTEKRNNGKGFNAYFQIDLYEKTLNTMLEEMVKLNNDKIVNLKILETCCVV